MNSTDVRRIPRIWLQEMQKNYIYHITDIHLYMIINMLLKSIILFIIKWEVNSDYSESRIEQCYLEKLRTFSLKMCLSKHRDRNL